MRKFLLAFSTVFLGSSVLGDGLLGDHEWGGSLRMRYESVDDSLNEVARAFTTRATGYFKTSSKQGLGFFAELEAVQGIGNYNDGGQNDDFTHATIADPDGLELNRFYVSFNPLEGNSDTILKIGRFNCNHADINVDRYLSNIGWRQNHRTYDGISFDSKFGKQRIRSAVIVNVNRVFGEDNPDPIRANFEVRAVGVQYDYSFSPAVNTEAYVYNFIFDDIPRFSTQTIGIKLFGETPISDKMNWIYKLDVARQQGIDENPNQEDKYSYSAVSLGVGLPEFVDARLTLNSEIFNSNGVESFITPLGSGHAYFGWADRFLSYPTIGINDTSLALDLKVGEYGVKLRWHSLRSDVNSIDYGSEFDWSVSGKISDSMSWTIKGALYEGDDNPANLPHLSRDTNKLWAWLSINL